MEATGLRKTFGDLVAVGGIDLTIPRGVCFGLLGPNGAGKTTTIRMIQTVSTPTAGTLSVLGMPHTKGRAIRARLGVVPQEDNLDPDFSVRDNLRIYARFFGLSGPELDARADNLLKFLGLTEKRDARIDQLSGGMKRRLVTARSLVADPDLLVLDEPTTGLDPQARHALWETIRELRRQGKTILLTTHYMDEAEVLCDELVIIDAGKILESGTPKDLILKHCGKEVVELVVRDGDTTRLDAIVASIGVPYERLPDRVIAFGSAESTMKPDETIIRRATLEDVFLRLTGRALRE